MADQVNPSWRKPVGMLAILAMIAAWCVGVASLSHWVGGWAWPLQLIFYVIAGVAWLWVLPMRRMLLWMETGRWRRGEAAPRLPAKAGARTG